MDLAVPLPIWVADVSLKAQLIVKHARLLSLVDGVSGGIHQSGCDVLNGWRDLGLYLMRIDAVRNNWI